MRLLDSSSSQGGSYASPLRGRDSLSSFQPSDAAGTVPSLDPSSGVGFFRPSIDFTSIFSRNSGPVASAPIASEPPSPSEPIDRTQHSGADASPLEPLNEKDDDEEVDQYDSIVSQQLATVADAPVDIAVDTLDHSPEGPAAESTDLINNRQTDSPTNDSPTNDSLTPTQATDSLSTGSQAQLQNEPASVGRAAESTGDRDTANPGYHPPRTEAGDEGDVASEASQTSATELARADGTNQANLATTAGDGSEHGRTGESRSGELAVQAHSQPDQAARGGSSRTGQGEEDVSRPRRNSRGRIGGNASQNGRINRAESPTQTRENHSTANAETVVDKAGAIDPSLANGPADSTAIQETVATVAAPTAGQSPVSEAGIFAGQNVNIGGPETGNLDAVGRDPSSDLSTIGPTSSDDSRRNGDQSAGRGAENLTRTDIADRARLIHRISKAFTKMGVDGGQIRMKMHPETLGGVLLEMRVRGRNVEATVTADNEAARDLLQQQLSELRQRLESQGMLVQRLEVALRDETDTSGSLLSDPRGEMSGGDRGTDDHGQSRRPAGSGNAPKRNVSANDNGNIAAAHTQWMAQPQGPAAPGTLDLRL